MVKLLILWPSGIGDGCMVGAVWNYINKTRLDIILKHKFLLHHRHRQYFW